MAEWTGRKRTLNSIEPVGTPPVDAGSGNEPPTPPAPGAEHSPQRPGETPDAPDLIGKPRGSAEPLQSLWRPLTEYGSAQRILGMFTFPAGAEVKPEDFEQGPSAQEEQRRANPALLTPARPLSGYGLGLGRSAPELPSETLEAIGDAQAVTTSADAGSAASAPAGGPSQVGGAAVPAPVDATGPLGAPTVPEGAVAGNGATECPPGFPIKGNAQSMLYHDHLSRSYARTAAQFCFSTPEAAQAAGYRAARDHS
jgi:hypothetical protein